MNLGCGGGAAPLRREPQGQARERAQLPTDSAAEYPERARGRVKGGAFARAKRSLV